MWLSRTLGTPLSSSGRLVLYFSRRLRKRSRRFPTQKSLLSILSSVRLRGLKQLHDLTSEPFATRTIGVNKAEHAVIREQFQRTSHLMHQSTIGRIRVEEAALSLKTRAARKSEPRT